MATIKVNTSNGVKELLCFDNFDNVPYEVLYPGDFEELPPIEYEEEKEEL